MALDLALLIRHSEEDFWVKQSINEIEEQYGDRVYVKPKSLLKFGASDDIDQSPELVWNQGGAETDLTDNLITHISSSSTSDEETVRIEGHTLSGGVFTFVTQDKALQGTTKTALDTPLARASRMFNIDSTELAGDVYVYEDGDETDGVPDTASDIHLKINAGQQQTAKAKTTFSDNDYFLCSNFFASVGEKTSATVDFYLEVREAGGVYRPRMIISTASTGGPISHDFRPYLIVPNNADIRIMAESSSDNTSVDAGFHGMIAKVR